MPLLTARSIAVTATWADSGASVESRTWINARQAPSHGSAGEGHGLAAAEQQTVQSNVEGQHDHGGSDEPSRDDPDMLLSFQAPLPAWSLAGDRQLLYAGLVNPPFNPNHRLGNATLLIASVTMFCI